MMAYYRFLQQVDAIILIEEKSVELKYLSEVDSLTQLWNRRKVDACLERIHREAVRLKEDANEAVDARKQDYAVILIDIDHFKSVNDRFGHPVGDEVLKQFGAILNGHTDSNEVLGRWGGEEFMILCSGDVRTRAGQLAESIRRSVEKHDFNISKPITCSLGVGFYKSGMQSHEVVHSADTALYVSKSSGRNRVTLGV
jgi:diguanylate cyclase (GGDEF)-like protein